MIHSKIWILIVKFKFQYIKVLLALIIFFTISCSFFANENSTNSNSPFLADFSDSKYKNIEEIAELRFQTEQFFIDSIKVYGRQNSINRIQEIEESFLFTCLHEFDVFWINHCEKSLINAMDKNLLDVQPVATYYSLSRINDEQHKQVFRWCLNNKEQYDCALFVYAWFDMRVAACIEIFSIRECDLMYDKVLGKYAYEISFVTH